MGGGWGWRGTKVKRLLPLGRGLTWAQVKVPIQVQAQRSGASCQVRLVQVRS